MGAAGRDADAVVLDFDDEPFALHPAAQGDGAAGDTGLEAVLDAVFDERLEEHAGNGNVQRARIDFLYDAELLAAEADNFNAEVVLGGG